MTESVLEKRLSFGGQDSSRQDLQRASRSYGAAPVEEVLRFLDACAATLSTESIPITEAGARVLATPLLAPHDLPTYRRAMMDGFAVRSDDLISASPDQPRKLRIVGDGRPGRAPQREIGSGETLDVTTGAPLPDSVDAVIPREQILATKGSCIEVSCVVIAGKHVGPIGEDVKQGEPLFTAGRRLRPQDLGLLSALGIAQVEVLRRPRVLIWSSGPEILAPGILPQPYQIADANSPMLRAAVERDGGVPSFAGTIADSASDFAQALAHEADLILISGGTSVGAEDWGPRVLAEIGRLEFHGIAMRPGAPTAIGSIGAKRVFLLPGNPVACFFAYDLLVGRLLRAMAGRKRDWPYPRTRGILTTPIPSQAGRVDYVRVKRNESGFEPVRPAGASLLSSTTRADGFVLVDASASEIPAGSIIEVLEYDA